MTKAHTMCQAVGDATGTNGTHGVFNCKKECLKVGCNTFTFDQDTLKCSLSKCSVSTLPLPDLDLTDTTIVAYHLLGNIESFVIRLN